MVHPFNSLYLQGDARLMGNNSQGQIYDMKKGTFDGELVLRLVRDKP